MRNGSLQDVMDSLARHGLLEELHFDDFRIGIHGDERRPGVAYGVDQVATNSGQFCDKLGKHGGSHRRGRSVNADNHRSPCHRELPPRVRLQGRRGRMKES